MLALRDWIVRSSGMFRTTYLLLSLCVFIFPLDSCWYGANSANEAEHLSGDEDFGNSPQMSSEISKQIKGSELKILPGLRHMALIEDANTVNNLLVEFLLRNVH